MRPVPHPAVTRRFSPPADWSAESHGECGTLEIADLETASGPYMESLWRPDSEDLAALNAGAAIALGIRGTGHPVVYLGVTAPPSHDAPPAHREAPAPPPEPAPAGMVVDLGVGRYTIGGSPEQHPPQLHFYAVRHDQPTGADVPRALWDAAGEPVLTLVFHDRRAIHALMDALAHAGSWFPIDVRMVT